jgi:NagD protein
LNVTINTPSRFYDVYIFDLDGTIYLGDSLLPDARETIRGIRHRGKRCLFLSNNPTRTRADYAKKLCRLGLPTELDDVINSSFVMVDYLRHELPAGRLFVIGEEPIEKELIEAGFELTEDITKIDAVIASFDRTFNYHKLQIAFDAIRAGAHFFATNADSYCPVPGGGEPDCGAIIAAIEACTHHSVEVVVGKPSQQMIATILDLVDAEPGQCLMIGDRLETDIQMGITAGIDTALVLTGVTTEADLTASRRQPTYVIRGIGGLISNLS